MTANDEAVDYYAANYRSYEAQNPPHKLAHYLSMVEQSYPGNAPVLLDIGCGPGAFLAHVAANRPDWTLYGTDMRPDAVESAVRALDGGAKFAAVAAETRPFGATAYDVITAWDVLEHLSDPAHTISNLKTWLNPGGVLLFVVPVSDGPTGPIVHLLDNDPNHIQKEGRDFWLEWPLGTSHESRDTGSSDISPRGSVNPCADPERSQIHASDPDCRAPHR